MRCVSEPSWLEWGSKDYYDKPWEVTADLFGGVQSREASRSDKADAFHYLWLSKQGDLLLGEQLIEGDI